MKKIRKSPHPHRPVDIWPGTVDNAQQSLEGTVSSWHGDTLFNRGEATKATEVVHRCAAHVPHVACARLMQAKLLYLALAYLAAWLNLGTDHRVVNLSPLGLVPRCTKPTRAVSISKISDLHICLARFGDVWGMAGTYRK